LRPFPNVAVEVLIEKLLRCDCGFEVHADDEAELVAEVRRHALGEHGMQLSPEEVMQLAARIGSAEGTWQQRLGD
jgi:predicted small metal-binding protein